MLRSTTKAIPGTCFWVLTTVIKTNGLPLRLGGIDGHIMMEQNLEKVDATGLPNEIQGVWGIISMGLQTGTVG